MFRFYTPETSEDFPSLFLSGGIERKHGLHLLLQYLCANSSSTSTRKTLGLRHRQRSGVFSSVYILNSYLLTGGLC